MINYSGLNYLQIDIANHYGYGLDKKSFEDRIIWVNTNNNELENLAEHAEDPARYTAAVMAYRDTQNGIPTGYLVGLDACASGIQVLSTLTGCKVGCKNTGLTGEDREDIYSTVTAVMNDLLDSNVQHSKKIVKKATMVYYYGSKAKPKEAFGEDTPELIAFYKAQEIVAPGAYKLVSTLINTWQNDALEHSWTMPDGFVVRNKVTQMVDTKIEVDELDHSTFMYRHEVNIGKEDGLANSANVTHSVDGLVNRELSRRCNYNRKQLLAVKNLIEIHLLISSELFGSAPDELLWLDHGFISLVGVEHFNIETMGSYGIAYCDALLALIEDTLQHKSFPCKSVHDEFLAHANNMNRVRQVYIDIFAELAESSVLDKILSSIVGHEMSIEKLSSDLGDDIRNGNYPIS